MIREVIVRDYQKELGAMLLEARKKLKKTRLQVAKELGVTTKTIKNWEDGTRPPSSERLPAMAITYQKDETVLATALNLIAKNKPLSAAQAKSSVGLRGCTTGELFAGASESSLSGGRRTMLRHSR